MSAKSEPTFIPKIISQSSAAGGSMSSLQLTDVPAVTISPSLTRTRLPHVDSFPNIKQSSSNLSLDRGLTASPIPWRDASMEVLVSPNDGPQISIEDFDLDDSPFYTDKMADFDTVSMCDPSAMSNKPTGRLKSEGSCLSNNPGVDKIIDRKFACYGISPRLPRKCLDTSNTEVQVAARGQRPTTLHCLSTGKTWNPRNESSSEH